jgi:very-short-patch-repair endonuclease
VYPIRRQISRHAAALRKNATDAERKLRAILRNRQIDGAKFRFQHSIEPFVVDACLEAKLIVEVDGSQHTEAVDAKRTRFLEAEGYRLLRFWSNDVLQNPEGVVEMIRAALAPSPLPLSRESAPGRSCPPARPKQRGALLTRHGARRGGRVRVFFFRAVAPTRSEKEEDPHPTLSRESGRELRSWLYRLSCRA